VREMSASSNSREKERLEGVIKGSISPYERFCDGAGSTPSSNYICAITLATGIAPLSLSHPGSRTLDEINAYDIAEAEGPYIGQINMIPASSFCGPMGAIWGYDLAETRGLRDTKLFDVERHDGASIPVFSAKPLIEASEALFGTREFRRFPLIPGAHVRTAYKDMTAAGPLHIYCGIGVGIPEDRQSSAVLWMEDKGTLSTSVERILELLAKSVVEIGKNQCVLFKEVFVHVEHVFVPEGHIGCALVAVPYILLAKRAVPDGDAGLLIELAIDEWEDRVRSDFLGEVECPS